MSLRWSYKILVMNGYYKYNAPNGANKSPKHYDHLIYRVVSAINTKTA